ncbi:hypothetical protein OEA41_007117 [Lepraria neglecta]|uniref:Zn(2)-C6 fungal-type domain-containing protein n=1 Tax=Lepraria neglecta TaxID=209136 RepID=A0AAE0DLH2_9LECA|nr:hypothetical protein OEA41_007117 [Lepraria neglecta]
MCYFSLSPGETTSPTTASQNNLSQCSSNPPSDSASANSKRATPPANGTNGTNGASGLNSRSCVTCRKRKVKCDKRHPCSNCNRAAIECVFPGPGRAPRRSRKPPDTELLARLRRLEGVVQSLGKGIDEDGETVIGHAEAENVSPQAPEQKGTDFIKKEKQCGILVAHEPSRIPETRNNDKKADGMVKEFGRLVVEDGRSRYVSNKFWSSLSDEVAEMQDILDDPTDEEDDYPSPGSGSSATANHQGFIFSFSSTVLSLRNFHPPQEQIPLYWNIYKTNIDPVIKLLHIPFHENMISKASQDLDNVSKPLEVFMFTIYYAAVTSLSPDDCILHLGLQKQAALRKYRFATEQALARTGFLSTQDFVVLQSMLLFLTCVRRSDDTRYVWTITGLLIRLAQAQGCHRDGQQFGISPFETEMRRRLWWQICTLDVRASEDHGADPSIIEQSFDTKFPLNINDEDISPTTKEAPEEREGATEMTFDLIRYSVSTTVRRLSYAPPGQGPCRTKSMGLSLEHKEHMIDELHQYLEKKYLRHLDTTVPLHWVAATVARLIMAKMWLIVHHPFSRIDCGAGLSQDVKDRLFLTSVEVIEFSRLLETEKTTLKWGWLFRTYVQWHALAFVLSQLCVRTVGPAVDKAWMVIEGVFDDWGGTVSSNQRGMLWKPLRKLMAKARAERSKGLQKQAQFPLDGSLGPATSSLGIPPGPMSTLNGMTDFQTFDTSMSVSDGFTNMMTPESVNSNGLQQPFLPLEQNQQNGLGDAGSFLVEPSVFAQERSIMDDNMNWTGWDDMVKDFQMEANDGQGGPNGPVLDGMINWW